MNTVAMCIVLVTPVMSAHLGCDLGNFNKQHSVLNLAILGLEKII